MTLQSAEPISVLDEYRGLVGTGHDQLIGPTGIRPKQARLAAWLDDLGPRGLAERRAQTARYVDDDGVTYGSGTDGRQGKNWVIDPVPMIIDAGEWLALERGLRQRNLVLDLLLTDLYGPRRCIAEGIVPPEVLAAHPGFLRVADGIRIPGAHQLVQVATDLGRGADGHWTAFGDRAEAPSGAGYAMATRRIASNVMSTLHRETPIARLRSFFHTMSAALLDAAPSGVEDPRIVLLSPGSESETAFDQAFLATLLGLPLVESVDLYLSDGRLRRRTTSGAEIVDIVVRRVDADWCDPLDLRGESRLGVPGLVEAARRGTVSVINPLGAGVLENPGFTRAMPDLCHYFLGEDLLLPNAQTFWCGDPAERSHVLTHLDELVVKPLSRSLRVDSLFGSELSGAARERLVRQIERSPWLWCAQEPLEVATTPVIGTHGLEPRDFVLRTFSVAHEDEYEVMPGGLGRVPRRQGDRLISNATGALAKDVWILLDEQYAGLDFPARTPREVHALHQRSGLSTRQTANLFWLGRYAERTEATARLLRVGVDLAEDHGRRPGTQGFEAMSAVLAGTSRVLAMPMDSGFGSPESFRDTHQRLRRAVLDAGQPGTVAYAAGRTTRCAQAAREILALDTWVVLARLDRLLKVPEGDDVELQPLLGQVQESVLAFAGLMSESMIRDDSWAYIDIGTRLERAQHTVSLIRAMLPERRSPNIEAMVTEAVLTAGESIITHRRRLASGTGPAEIVGSMVNLLMLDATNPRSVTYQLERMEADFEMVGTPQLSDRCHALRARLAGLDPDALAVAGRVEVERIGQEVSGELRDMSRAFEEARLAAPAQIQTQQPEWGALATDQQQMPGVGE